MTDDTEPESDRLIPANYNHDPDAGRHETDQQTRQQVDRVVLTIARLIGRRIAQEQFAARSATSDNKPNRINVLVLACD